LARTIASTERHPSSSVEATITDGRAEEGGAERGEDAPDEDEGADEDEDGGGAEGRCGGVKEDGAANEEGDGRAGAA
jgi:hypothetical protein